MTTVNLFSLGGTHTMRIDRSFQIHPATVEKANLESQKHESASKGGDSLRATIPVEGDTAALVKKMRELPDLGGERVLEVKQRFAKGEYMTQDAAEKTADAIIKQLAGR